jgi:glycosyltransferase involved in cell wall biosynthesis
MKVSVIIPVYNAERFIEKAVRSALNEPETGEVLLIDDASSDSSVTICKRLQEEDPRVKLYMHPNKGNHGTAVSRNLGITKAGCELISFLDNDDFYLPGRFTKAIAILSSDASIDGVYEAIGTYAYDDESMEQHLQRMRAARAGKEDLMLTTITQALPPAELFEAVIFDRYGWFHINGLTLRRSVIERTGLLDPELRWDEDTEFFYRLTYKAKLVAGRLEKPVAMRGVYKGNRTLSEEGQKKAEYYHTFMWPKMFRFMLDNKMNKTVSRLILRRYLEYYDPSFLEVKSKPKRLFLKAMRLTGLFLKHPVLFARLFG